MEDQTIGLVPERGRVRGKTDLVVHVRLHLSNHLHGGSLSLPSVARALGMGERTLQRRLRAAGTTFGKQLRAFRAERAAELRSQKALSAEEVAEALGYEDARSVRRIASLIPYRDLVTPSAARTDWPSSNQRG